METLRHWLGMWLSQDPTVIVGLNQRWNSLSEAVLSSPDSQLLSSCLQTVVSYSKTHSTLICSISSESWFRVVCLTKKVLVIFIILFQRQRIIDSIFFCSWLKSHNQTLLPSAFEGKLKEALALQLLAAAAVVNYPYFRLRFTVQLNQHFSRLV